MGIVYRILSVEEEVVWPDVDICTAFVTRNFPDQSRRSLRALVSSYGMWKILERQGSLMMHRLAACLLIRHLASMPTQMFASGLGQAEILAKVKAGLRLLKIDPDNVKLAIARPDSLLWNTFAIIADMERHGVSLKDLSFIPYIGVINKLR